MGTPSSMTRTGKNEPFELQSANIQVSAGLDILYIKNEIPTS